MRTLIYCMLITAMVPGSRTPLVAQFLLDVETGKVYTGYNRVQIPGDTGTRFSLDDDLDAESPYYYRVKVEYSWNQRHTFGLLYAPLQVTSKGRLSEPLRFNEDVFAAHTRLTVRYTFNSYRATYRYRLIDRAGWQFGLGVSGKIRDASIEVENGTTRSKKSNIGFVPLINYRIRYSPFYLLSFVSEGDLLAAPQGRAEDLFLGIQCHAASNIDVKAGYRMLEGGADNDEVYTFALFHYAVLGIVLTI
jgi:hypothetical protein